MKPGVCLEWAVQTHSPMQHLTPDGVPEVLHRKPYARTSCFHKPAQKYQQYYLMETVSGAPGDYAEVRCGAAWGGALLEF